MSERTKGLLISILIYLIGVLIGVGCGYLFRGIPIFANFVLSDIIATIYIWTMSTILKSSILYRPYWSLQTFCMYVAILIFYDSFSFSTFVLAILITLWSLNHTLYHLSHFQGLDSKEEKSELFKEKTGAFYPIVNLFLLQLLPTLLIYLASLPIYNYAFNNASSNVYNPFDLIGEAIMLIGITIESLSLYQSIKSEKNEGTFCETGLWKYSRHPEYLGEIIFFFGMFLVYMLDVMDIKFIYWIASPISVLLYLVIIALIEESQLKKRIPEYESYQKKTSFLLLLPSKNE